jgi:hypothetical protein
LLDNINRMLSLSDKLQSKLVSLISFIVVFYLIKPSITFKPDGTLREFGVGYSKDGYRKTFLTLLNIIILLSFYL